MSNLSVCRVKEEVWQWSGSAGRCGVRHNCICASKGKHVDENNLDIIRIFNVEETGPSTIQSTQEVLQILGWVGLRTLLTRWNAWRYRAARAASSGTQWSEELGPDEKDKNNNRTELLWGAQSICTTCTTNYLLFLMWSSSEDYMLKLNQLWLPRIFLTI